MGEIISTTLTGQSGETAASLGAASMPGASIESPIQLAQLGVGGPPATGQQIDIGKVTKVEGQVSVQHPDGTSSALSLGAKVLQGDTVTTSDNSAITITFVDGTTFALGGNAKMVMDELIYDPNSQSGSAFMSVVQGTFVFLTGQIAASGPDAMKVATPAGTIGIRGTKVGCVVEVGSSATTCVNLPIGLKVPEEGEAPTQQRFGSWVFVNEAATILVSAPNQAIVAFDRISTPITSILSDDEVQSLFGTLDVTRAGPELQFALSQGGVLIEPELNALLFGSRGPFLSSAGSSLNGNGPLDEPATGATFFSGTRQLAPVVFDFNEELGGGDGTVIIGSEIVDIDAPPMTSGGVPVEIRQVSPTEVRGVLEGTDEVVFVFTIDPDIGEGSFTEILPLDHPIPGATGSADTITIVFNTEITNISGEVTTLDVIVSIPDDGPTAVAGLAAEVFEGQTAPLNGINLLQNDIAGADGARVSRITYEGGSADIASGGSVTVTTALGGVLTVGADGSWSYQAPATVPGTADDSFIYTIVDGDGDTSSASQSLTVNNLAIGEVIVPDNLTSGGLPVTIEQDLNEVRGVLPDGEIVFVFTLDPLTDQFTFTSNLAFDNPDGGETQNIVFTISGPDGEPVNITIEIVEGGGNSVSGSIFGDVTASDVTVSVQDDRPTVAANATILLDDDAQAGGIAGGVGDDPNSANVSGTLGHSFGTDGGAIAWLTSGAPDGFSYVADGDNLLIKQGATTVLTLTLDTATGAYTVTQNAAIDHAPGDAENNQPFTVTYQVTDGDGDTADGTLAIDVDDDTPTVAANATVRLDDDALSGGIAGGVGDDPNSANVSGTLGHSFGADGGSIAWLTSGAPDGFSYVADGDNLLIKQGETTVLTLTLDTATGAYTVTQNAAIAHDAGLNENNQPFTVTYRVTDGDGDTADSTLAIDVDDDTPTVAANATVLLDDDALSGGNAGGVGDDPNSANVSGTLGHGFGADGGSIAWLTSGAPDGFSYVADGDNLLIKQGETTVLTLTLDTATGAYTVVQNAAIDHAAGLNENNQPFTVTYLVTDGDGDTANSTLAINVDDDTPTAVIDTPVSVQEGASTISGNVLANDTPGADGGTLSHVQLPGGSFVAISSGTDLGSGLFGFEVTNLGTYTFLADGAWTFTPVDSVDNSSGDVDASFSYRLTDGDGDTDEASQVLSITDSGVPTVSPNATVLLDDDALGGGNADGVGDNADAVNLTGTLGHSFGADGGSIAWLTSGAPDGFSYVADGDDLLIKQGTTTVLTLTLDTATGAYTVAQNAAIDHAAGGDENNQPFTVTYRVTDGDGDTADGTLAIDVDDDTPTAVADANTATEGDPTPVTGNVLTNDTEGADGATVSAITFLNSIGETETADVPQDGSSIMVETFLGGMLTIDQTGQYSYLAPPSGSILIDSNDVFSYDLTDGDEDTVSADLTIGVTAVTERLTGQIVTNAPVAEQVLLLTFASLVDPTKIFQFVLNPPTGGQSDSNLIIIDEDTGFNIGDEQFMLSIEYISGDSQLQITSMQIGDISIFGSGANNTTNVSGNIKLGFDANEDQVFTTIFQPSDPNYQVEGPYVSGGQALTDVSDSGLATVNIGVDGVDDSPATAGQTNLMVGGTGADTLVGGAEADYLFGEQDNDILTGNGGNDLLSGGTGQDILSGGPGNDILVGGPGLDTNTGGGGADTFKYFNTADGGVGEVITDYDIAGGDRLDIHELLENFDPVTSTLNDFVSRTATTDPGTGDISVLVQVDTDGSVGGAAFVPLVTLQLVSPDLAGLEQSLILT